MRTHQARLGAIPDRLPVGKVCACGRHLLATERDLVFVCLTCRRALDETGRWVEAQPYLALHSEMAVSVADDLCPECRSMRGRAP
jgi:hypothetical protein